MRKVDAAKRAEIAVPDFLSSSFGDFALQFQSASVRAPNQLALRDRGLDEGPAVDFSPPLGGQCSCRRLRLVQRDWRKGDVSVARLDKMPRRAQDENPGKIAWVVLDEQFSFQPSHIRCEDRRPVRQAKKVNAIRTQSSLLFRQERHPERHSVDWHAQLDGRLVVEPDGDRRALERAMDAVVVASGDLVPDPALKLPKR